MSGFMISPRFPTNDLALPLIPTMIVHSVLHKISYINLCKLPFASVLP